MRLTSHEAKLHRRIDPHATQDRLQHLLNDSDGKLLGQRRVRLQPWPSALAFPPLLSLRLLLTLLRWRGPGHVVAIAVVQVIDIINVFKGDVFLIVVVIVQAGNVASETLEERMEVLVNVYSVGDTRSSQAVAPPWLPVCTSASADNYGDESLSTQVPLLCYPRTQTPAHIAQTRGRRSSSSCVPSIAPLSWHAASKQASKHITYVVRYLPYLAMKLL